MDQLPPRDIPNFPELFDGFDELTEGLGRVALNLILGLCALGSLCAVFSRL